ncbi:MAG: NitT/TauT family transport system substrate-binding protein [Pirellulaceae bacterium]|jgi:NitT/TauT family transport system substrate-binding protein
MFSNNRIYQLLLLPIVAISMIFTSCGSPTTIDETNGSGLTKVRLQLNWFPEHEHGGFYAAKAKGYFAEEGLDVEIIPGGPKVNGIQEVVSERVDFAIANADQILLGRAQEADVVALMSPMQDSPRCIMVHESSGISKFEDLKGITISLSGGKPFVAYLIKKGYLKEAQLVPFLGGIGRFLEEKDFAQQGYVFSEPIQATTHGSDPVALMVSDVGFNPYTGLLFTHGDTIRNKPELVAKVVRASVRGWQDFLADPSDTNKVILQENEDLDEVTLTKGVDALQPLCLPNQMPADQIGKMASERWQQLHDQLVEIEMLEENVDVEKAFTMKFLLPNDPK